MNLEAAKLLFDECIGLPSVRLLRDQVAIGGGEKPEIKHLLEIAPPGTRDEDWIPRIAEQGWTVITTDGGKTPNRKRGEKLPRLCARHRVSHILISSYVHGRFSFEKLLTILSVWYQILEFATDPARRGDRFGLEPDLSTRGRGKLMKKTIPRDHMPPGRGVE